MTGYGALEKARRDSRNHNLKTYKRGRICEIEGCDTVLSFYNPTSICALHSTREAPTVKKERKKPKERQLLPRICIYEPCSKEFLAYNGNKKYCSDLCRARAYADRHPSLKPVAKSKTVKPIRRVISSYKHPKMSWKSLEVLFFLLENPNRSFYQLEVADGTGLRVSTVHSILARYWKRGWIESKWGRKYAGHKKRYYRLTLKGLDNARQIKEEMVITK
jgi:DNA-binding MarR family transcriptional regulator